MFKRQKCARCGKKISESYSFCPYCGNHLNEGDWGMLGKNDFINQESQNNLGLPPGINSIFNFLMKNLDKQINQGNNDLKNKKGISISISSGGGNPKINVSPFGETQNSEKEKKIKEIPLKKFSEDNIKRFQSLKRTEPKTEMRRFSEKVVFEVSLPGVKTTDDISITKLENSMELRAIAKSKAYFKIIPLNLPIMNYALEKGKLILELKAE
ncbi:MAG TPA: zinc ribbon domain-containing protein [Patescibacteria group bacterium]|nr:zinc ribbon domain-containing protein [Patescibacteria group bacterium]